MSPTIQLETDVVHLTWSSSFIHSFVTFTTRASLLASSRKPVVRRKNNLSNFFCDRLSGLFYLLQSRQVLTSTLTKLTFCQPKAAKFYAGSIKLWPCFQRTSSHFPTPSPAWFLSLKLLPFFIILLCWLEKREWPRENLCAHSSFS